MRKFHTADPSPVPTSICKSYMYLKVMVRSGCSGAIVAVASDTVADGVGFEHAEYLEGYIYRDYTLDVVTTSVNTVFVVPESSGHEFTSHIRSKQQEALYRNWKLIQIY